MEETQPKKQSITLSDRMRVIFKGTLDGVGAFFNRLGIYPNTMTLIGLAGNVIAAVLLALGYITVGGVLVLVMGLVDTVDGTMARLRGMPSEFGAFVDSVTDRYSELVIFGGLMYYFLAKGDWISGLGLYIAAGGSVLVSYVRARAAAVGMDTKVGFLSRFERYLVLAPTLIFNIPVVGIWIIAVFANFTALQRILDVRRQAHEQNKILRKN
ncbi:MAG TPA: CDP-alcohol phosphatidyltransferase family protein [Anaerolineales bacterium]|nr:CDP-alcohol phosphatidyltransferase family protein [Anaerolineales bacterium]